MTIDTNVQTFTDTELLNLNRKAQAEIYAYGSSIGGDGRQLTRADLRALQDAEALLVAKIQAASGGVGGNIALGVFADPV